MPTIQPTNVSRKIAVGATATISRTLLSETVAYAGGDLACGKKTTTKEQAGQEHEREDAVGDGKESKIDARGDHALPERNEVQVELQRKDLHGESRERHEIERHHHAIRFEVAAKDPEVRPPKTHDDEERYEERDEADGALNEVDRVRRNDEAQAELREAESDNDIGERLEAANHIFPSVPAIVHTLEPFRRRAKVSARRGVVYPRAVRDSMRIRTLAETFALVRLPASAAVPAWVGGRDLIAVVRTRDELSIVCRADTVPADVAEVEWGFRGLGVVGTLDFGITSVIAGLTAPLAAAEIPIFNISTFDTDYILLREEHLEKAKAALSAAGYVLD
jgi:hypothetical protein